MFLLVVSGKEGMHVSLCHIQGYLNIQIAMFVRHYFQENCVYLLFFFSFYQDSLIFCDVILCNLFFILFCRELLVSLCELNSTLNHIGRHSDCP